MGSILAKAQSMKEEMMRWRHRLHRLPELGLEEFKTTAFIKDQLHNLGVEILPLPLKTGVIGLLKGGGEGPFLALRADIDALPIEEAPDLPYASEHQGKMHACGHDGHMAILLGAAKLLSYQKEALKGGVLFIFQPAEETLVGAHQVVETGIFRDYNISFILGLHGSPLVPLGKVGYLSQEVMAAADKFTVQVRGKGGHGAYPHLTYDPISAMAQMIMGLFQVVSREVNPLESVVLSIGKIRGGEAFNIIPQEVEFSGTVRTFNEDLRKGMEGRIERIVSGYAMAARCQCSLDYIEGVPPLNHDPSLIKKVVIALEKVIGEERLYKMKDPFMGSEDFSIFLKEVPGIYLHIGLKDPGKKMVMLHHESFDFNDDALPLGATVMASLALDKLTS